MANEEHLKILKQGAETWNAWRARHPEIRPNLNGAELNDGDLFGADLNHSYLIQTQLSCADLRHADLTFAEVSDADLSEAKLGGADLSHADLRGVDAGGAILRAARLTNSNLTGAYLIDADLSYADLQEANLSHANLLRADFSEAKLAGADLSWAGLINVSLVRADLSATNLIDATLYCASIEGIGLAGVEMGGTILAALDLRLANGLAEITHHGTSEVTVGTLKESRGRIPEIFLRGCGLSDWEITAAKLHDPDLTSEQVIDLTYEIARIKAESPIQINPIFISYSRTDSDFVEALATLLDEKHIRYWRDVHDLKAGRLETQIDRAIRQNPIVLLVLSKDSVKSDWVEWEITKARELEREQDRDVLCPITLDDSWKDSHWEGPLRRQVEKYNILDFSRWEDDNAMAVAFKKLIDGLGLFYPKAS